MKNLFLVILFLGLGLFSCETNNQEMDWENSTTKEQDCKALDVLMILGEKINDPYDINNIKAAYSSLLGKRCQLMKSNPIKNILGFYRKMRLNGTY